MYQSGSNRDEQLLPPNATQDFPDYPINEEYAYQAEVPHVARYDATTGEIDTYEDLGFSGQSSDDAFFENQPSTERAWTSWDLMCNTSPDLPMAAGLAFPPRASNEIDSMGLYEMPGEAEWDQPPAEPWISMQRAPPNSPAEGLAAGSDTMEASLTGLDMAAQRLSSDMQPRRKKNRTGGTETRAVCPTCHQTFSREADRKRHGAAHDPEKRVQHKCPYPGCSGRPGWPRKDKLNTHIKNYHASEPVPGAASVDVGQSNWSNNAMHLSNLGFAMGSASGQGDTPTMPGPNFRTRDN